ncbi:MAG: cation:proton antiporter [Planctomycetes bacterium]|jgi:multicomponent Na+:H+ antiporter subunit C|nr:cation:proton antiporter [Planctomycetota bacterium]
MFLLMAITVGALVACGLYLMMRRSMLKLVLGLLLLSHGANLAVFTSAGLVRDPAPLTAPGATAPPDGSADPLPQALVLTAIVIGFAVVSFAAVLVRRATDEVGTDDSDQMRSTDT